MKYQQRTVLYDIAFNAHGYIHKLDMQWLWWNISSALQCMPLLSMHMDTYINCANGHAVAVMKYQQRTAMYAIAFNAHVYSQSVIIFLLHFKTRVRHPRWQYMYTYINWTCSGYGEISSSTLLQFTNTHPHTHINAKKGEYMDELICTQGHQIQLRLRLRLIYYSNYRTYSIHGNKDADTYITMNSCNSTQLPAQKTT